LEIEISCTQWEGLACTQSALIFFLLSFLGGGIFFIFTLFPKCSLQVPSEFPSISNMFPRRFPIAPHFNPICFVQSPPLLTYIGAPKGEALHLSIESSILGNLHSFNFFFVTGQLNWLIVEKKVGLVRHLQPINMKQK
jgi:hypothetical protein